MFWLLVPFNTVAPLLQLFVLLFWPISAAVFGPESVSSLSLFLFFYIVVTDVARKWLQEQLADVGSVISCILEVLLMVSLMVQPFALMPQLLVTIYTLSLKYMAEPFFLWIEVREVVDLIRRSGQKFNAWIYEVGDDFQWVFQALVIIITLGAFALAATTIRSGLLTADSPLFTHFSVFLLLLTFVSIVITIHKDEGIISDSALVCLASSVCLLASVTAFSSSHRISDAVNLTFLNTSSSKSYLHQMLDLPEATTALATESVRWLKVNYGFSFWISFGARIICMLLWMRRDDFSEERAFYSQPERDAEEDEDKPLFRRITSFAKAAFSGHFLDKSTLSKLLGVLIYSQMIVQNTPFEEPLPLVPIGVLSFSRVCQSFSVGLYYLYSLSSHPNEDERVYF